jgi:23S rRNA (uracil1939-C5)-methyltransferase
MKVKKGEQFEVVVSDVVFGGRGITKIDGYSVFVDQVAPLDVAVIKIIKKKKNYAEARVIQLIKPSPYRIQPPCLYSGFCGGCKWQFLNYEQQLISKRQHVSDALERIGKCVNVLVHPAIPSEEIFGYRNKMEFSCSDRRWLLPSEMGVEGIDSDFALGLHVPGTFHKVIDVQECLLQPNLGNLILNDIRNYMRESDAPVYGLRSHFGFWRFVMLRHSATYDRWMVNLVTASENPGTVQPLADLLVQKYPEITSVVNNITTRKAGIAVGEYEVCLAGDPYIRDRVGPFEFEVSANSFFQVNTKSAHHIFEIVKDYAGLTGNETVVDLYSGTGTIGIFLSKAAREIIGIEMVESAIQDARKNCKINRISNCRFICGDILHTFDQIQKQPDVIIIDPPRSGMHKGVVKQILEMSPDRMVYVSCNPTTLARDLDLMKHRYAVVEVQPVDMFPHTYHIESIAKLRRI